MKNLIVVGNGFDIAHGINSRYSDFYMYLKSYEVQLIPMFPEYPQYARLDSISPEDRKKHDLIEKLEKYICKEDLWSSFEEALGNLDYEQLKEDNSDYLIGPGSDEWTDSANHDYQYMIQEELKFTDDIDYQFKRWICNLNTKVLPLPSVLNILNTCMRNTTVFLSFNYTNTLENIYGIAPNDILYIHGKVGDSGKLVLGHHDDSVWNVEKIDTSKMTEEQYNNYQEYMMGEDFREVETEGIIRDYFKITYKDTDKIIHQNKFFFAQLNDCDRVFILGHSLSDIDFSYFDEIKNMVMNNCMWYISCYSQEDINNANYFVRNLGIQNYQFIQL